jgi:hypothetical protein
MKAQDTHFETESSQRYDREKYKSGKLCARRQKVFTHQYAFLPTSEGVDGSRGGQA